jgi:hypothetical protein
LGVTNKTAAAKLRAEIARREAENKWKERVELEWQRYLITEDWTQFYPYIKRLVESSARYYANYRYKNARIYYDDFFSCFQYVAWQIANETHYSGDVKFLDRLKKRLNSRAVDLFREFTTQGDTALTFAVNIDKLPEREYASKSTNYRTKNEKRRTNVVRNKIPLEYERRHLENTACNRVFVEQLINDPVLNDTERRLLVYIYRNPDSTTRQWARAVGLKHHEQAARMMRQIRKKLKKYEGEALL